MRPKSRSTSAAPATTTWAARRADDAGRRHRQSRRCCAVLDGEALWSRKAGAAGQVLRRLPRRRRDQHEGRRRALSGASARRRGRPINLEQRINLCRTDQQQAPPLALESQRAAGAHRLSSRTSRAAMPIAPPTTSRRRPFLEAGRAIYQRRQGQLNLSCAQLPRRQLGPEARRQRRSRRRIRPAIRSTGWNGRASARCSAGCATAWSGCARSPMPTARPNTSSSSSS